MENFPNLWPRASTKGRRNVGAKSTARIIPQRKREKPGDSLRRHRQGSPRNINFRKGAPARTSGHHRRNFRSNYKVHAHPDRVDSVPDASFGRSHAEVQHQHDPTGIFKLRKGAIADSSGHQESISRSISHDRAHNDRLHIDHKMPLRCNNAVVLGEPTISPSHATSARLVHNVLRSNPRLAAKFSLARS